MENSHRQLVDKGKQEMLRDNRVGDQGSMEIPGKIGEKIEMAPIEDHLELGHYSDINEYLEANFGAINDNIKNNSFSSLQDLEEALNEVRSY